jgi:hypothetical protein
MDILIILVLIFDLRLLPRMRILHARIVSNLVLLGFIFYFSTTTINRLTKLYHAPWNK